MADAFYAELWGVRYAVWPHAEGGWQCAVREGVAWREGSVSRTLAIAACWCHL